MATATQVGQAGLQGWREKVADGIAQPVASRTQLDEDRLRGLIGGAFLVLSLIYVAKALTAVMREVRRT
jgi:hypothetical protein